MRLQSQEGRIRSQYKSCCYFSPSELTVIISIVYTPPPGFTPESPNQYRAASGPVVVTCTATGGSGSIQYQWSSTCMNCPFQNSSSNTINRAAVHSGDIGTHTCTASENGSTASASTEFIIVGKCLPMIYMSEELL